MRVGLYIHNYAPIEGGSYTFQREILSAASILSNQSEHHFFVLNYSNQSPADPSVLPGLDLINIEFPPRHLSQKIFYRLKVFTEKQSALSALDFTVKNIASNLSGSSPRLTNKPIYLTWQPYGIYNIVFSLGFLK